MKLIDPKDFESKFPGAVIDKTARIESGAIIERGAYIENGAYIGSGAYIERGAYIENGAYIGSGAYIVRGAYIERGAYIGEQIIVPSGARIDMNHRITQNPIALASALYSVTLTEHGIKTEYGQRTRTPEEWKAVNLAKTDIDGGEADYRECLDLVIALWYAHFKRVEDTSGEGE